LLAPPASSSAPPAATAALQISPGAGGAQLAASNVFASSYEPIDGLPKYAVDGRMDTRWAASGSGQSLTLDWGSRKTVRQLRLGFYQGAARVYAFGVFSSDDNRTYASAGIFRSSGRTDGLETFGIAAAGRYLRIVGYGNTVNGWISLTEAQAFGESALVSSAPASGSGSTLLLNDGFESPLLDPAWLASGNDTAAPVPGIARGGSRSLQMKVGPADVVKYRTELTRGDAAGDFDTGSTYCIGFSWMAKNWSTIPAWNSIFQTHSVPNSWSSGYHAGRNSIDLTLGADNTVSLEVVKDQKTGAADGSAGGQKVASLPLKFGAWYDFVFRFRPSKDVDGIIEAWANGAKLYSQLGRPNMDLYDSGGQPLKNNVYLKIGIYKEYADTGSQEIYYDNVKIIKNPVSCSGEAMK